MKIGTFCTGIDAAGVAMAPLGAVSVYMAEIEPYPSAVLAYRHGATRPLRMPDPAEAATLKVARQRRAAIKAVERVPFWGSAIVNYGDMTQIVPEELPFCDLLVAGCPCQAFSIAGLRQSLADTRGNLTLYFVKLVHELVRLGRIRSILYENVPDLLNTKDNAFGAFLGGLVGHDTPLVSPLPGGRWTNSGVVDGPLGTAAWRVEDAQYSGLAQRRERVFVVASFGNGPDPVEVLLERQSVPGDSPPRREPGQTVAPTLSARTKGGGGLGTDFDCDGGLVHGPQWGACPELAPTLNASYGEQTGQDFANGLMVADSRPPSGFVVDSAYSIQAGALRENPESGPDGVGVAEQLAYTLEARAEVQAVAFSIMPQNSGKDYKARVVEVAQPLMAGGPVGGNQGGDYIVQRAAFNLFPSGPGGETHAVETDTSFALTSGGEAKTNGRGLHLVEPIAFSLRGREGGAMPECETDGLSPALRAAEGGSTRPFIAFDETQITSAANRSNPKPGDPCHPLAASARPPTLASDMAVRRITCVEAERLQGFDDNYTLIPWPTANRKGSDLAESVAYLMGHGYSREEAENLAQTPDGPRYKAIGNSKAVPLVRKIGAQYQAALTRYLASREAA